MKKILFTILLVFASLSSFAYDFKRGAFVDFSVTASANYIYRGERIAGLSIQPELSFGYGDKYGNSISVGAWGTLSDPLNEHCVFCQFNFHDKPYGEVDLFIEYAHKDIISIGLNHMYYCDGSPMFYFANNGSFSSTQTEVYAQLCVSEGFPLTIFWGTIIGGEDASDWWNDKCKDRPYSSYLEVSYPIDFGETGWSLTPIVGMSPWKGCYTGPDKEFAFNNVQLNVTKEWEIGKYSYIDLYADLIFNLTDISCFGYNETILWNLGLTIGF
jgi:hypothetical protein